MKMLRAETRMYKTRNI